MHDSDLSAFMTVFHKLRGVFPTRGSAAEASDTAGVYFNLLRDYSLEAVSAGAEAYLGTGKFFPKPADWIGAIPRELSTGGVPMSPFEAREHQRAVAKGYQDEPCGCQSCVSAGVSHRFLRYVPDIGPDGNDVRLVLGGAIVARGHWAHGQELARFYAAKDAYTEAHQKLIKKLRTMPKVTPRQIAAEDEGELVGQSAPERE